MGEREGNSRHITSPACGSRSQIVSNPRAQSVSLAGKGEGAGSQPSVPTTRALALHSARVSEGVSAFFIS